MIYSNISLLLYFSFIYILGLSIFYFSKSRMNNIENKLYSRLLILNIVGLLLQWSCEYVSVNYNIVPIWISNIIFKSFTLYFIVWINLMLDYVLAIAFDNKNELIIGNIVLTVIESVIVLLLPFELYRDEINSIYYTHGLAINATFIISAILMNIMFWIIIIKRKNIKVKKVVPIFIFMFFGALSAVLQQSNPSLVIIAVAETFICFLMYFTIENPDMRLIEQLNIAKDQADKANRAKTDFLSSMSHEIRTPLNAIVGFSNSLKDNDNLPDQAKSDVKDILIASDSLLEIVNGVLDISKIEANKIEIIDKEYDAYKMFDELSKLTKVRIGEKPIEFITKIDETIPRVLYGDQVRVKQIVLNLLTNAAKYTDEGKIIFKVDSVITGDIVRLIISVEDTGRGIKKDAIDKLFTKFERLEEDRNTTIEGTGLGLAITKKLIELMHGNIIVTSDYGKGSKFTVTLDQSIVKNPTIKLDDDNNDNKEVLDLKGKKVLVVDDNNLNIKVATRLLSKYNLIIESVTSGFDAIDLINKGNKYDLILLDDMMPKLSGSETLNKLKEIDGFNIPVVALTANALTGMKEKYLEAGFNDYLAKPIETDELTRVLKTYLENVK